MHATTQWKETGSINISTLMLKQMAEANVPCINKTHKSELEANLFHIKAATCGRLTKIFCPHLDVGLCLSTYVSISSHT